MFQIVRLIGMATAIVLAATVHGAFAHGVTICSSETGELRIFVEAPLPVQLPPSVFPGVPGWADAEPGIAAAEIEEPDEGIYFLDPGSYIQYELISFDPGIQIVTDHVWVPGELFDFGTPFFDDHLLYNITGGELGTVYSLRFRVRDLNGIHPGEPEAELLFTPVATSCLCRGDLDGNSLRNGKDVQGFVTCMLTTVGQIPPECACADMDGDGAFDDGDVELFVGDVLSAESCEH